MALEIRLEAEESALAVARRSLRQTVSRQRRTPSPPPRGRPAGPGLAPGEGVGRGGDSAPPTAEAAGGSGLGAGEGVVPEPEESPQAPAAPAVCPESNAFSCSSLTQVSLMQSCSLARNVRAKTS